MQTITTIITATAADKPTTNPTIKPVLLLLPPPDEPSTVVAALVIVTFPKESAEDNADAAASLSLESTEPVRTTEPDATV